MGHCTQGNKPDTIFLRGVRKRNWKQREYKNDGWVMGSQVICLDKSQLAGMDGSNKFR